MPTKTLKIEFVSTVYDRDKTEIKKYKDTGEPIISYVELDGSYPFATGIPIGNGLFITAAHSFDFIRPSVKPPYEAGRFVANKVIIENVDSWAWTYLKPWDAIQAYDTNDLDNFQLNDLAAVKANVQVADSKISSFVVFADIATINKIMANKSITLSGQTSGTTAGIYINAHIEGQFAAAGQSENGDSGAPGVVSLENQDYISGILSRGNFGNTINTFSYLNPSDYYRMTSVIKSGSGNDYTKIAPDIIYSQSGDSSKYFRGSDKKAGFIINNDDSAILLGSHKDLVNTGSGATNILFTQDTIGSHDEGTTFVVSPGNDIIVGASSNDRIVMLKDRLYDSNTGAPTADSLTGKSDFIELKGGIYYIRDDGGMAGGWSPYYGRDIDNLPETENYNYNVSYLTEDGENGIDLIIKVSALDHDFKVGGRASDTIWTSEIRVVDFQEGDLGLKFINNALWINEQDPNEFLRKQDAASAELLSNAQSSEYINDYPDDNWNGVHAVDSLYIDTATINTQLSNIQSLYQDIIYA